MALGVDLEEGQAGHGEGFQEVGALGQHHLDALGGVVGQDTVGGGGAAVGHALGARAVGKAEWVGCDIGQVSGVGDKLGMAGGDGFKAVDRGIRPGAGEVERTLPDIGANVKDHAGLPLRQPPGDQAEDRGQGGGRFGHGGVLVVQGDVVGRGEEGGLHRSIGSGQG